MKTNLKQFHLIGNLESCMLRAVCPNATAAAQPAHPLQTQPHSHAHAASLKARQAKHVMLKQKKKKPKQEIKHTHKLNINKMTKLQIQV